jgi:hypothetical protein
MKMTVKNDVTAGHRSALDARDPPAGRSVGRGDRIDGNQWFAGGQSAIAAWVFSIAFCATRRGSRSVVSMMYASWLRQERAAS